jgi:hypothetical protein
MHRLENFLPASPSYSAASHFHNCGSSKQGMEVQPLHTDRGPLGVKMQLKKGCSSEQDEFCRYFSGILFQ